MNLQRERIVVITFTHSKYRKYPQGYYHKLDNKQTLHKKLLLLQFITLIRRLLIVLTNAFSKF